MRDRGESTGPRANSQVTTQSQRWDMCRGENSEQGNKYSVAVCESVHIVGVCGNNECSLEQSRWYQEGDRTWLGLGGVSRRLGEQPEQRYRGWGFPRGHWSREDTGPVEHQVYVRKPGKRGSSEEMRGLCSNGPWSLAENMGLPGSV